jgi:hypothetical protein
MEKRNNLSSIRPGTYIPLRQHLKPSGNSFVILPDGKVHFTGYHASAFS